MFKPRQAMPFCLRSFLLSTLSPPSHLNQSSISRTNKKLFLDSSVVVKATPARRWDNAWAANLALLIGCEWVVRECCLSWNQVSSLT